MTDNILEIKGLTTQFLTKAGVITAVDDMNLALGRGTTLALVGESGCGKSVASLSIMRLVPPPGRIVAGQVLFNGIDLLTLDGEAMRRLRGREIAMIFQDPMTSLNPVYTVGDQIAEAIQLHQGVCRKNAWIKAVEIMGRVRIPDSERRAYDFPYQLSGGMRQRVMIAMALSCGPKLLIADEPTTALDVTIQAEILDLLRSLQADFHLSMLLITHDLGVVAETARHVAVMYAGRIVETAPARDIFEGPRHPYTEGLLRSVPSLGEKERAKRLEAIEGTVPSLLDLPGGCAFAPRCPYVVPECVEKEIPLLPAGDSRSSRCIRFERVGDYTARTQPGPALRPGSGGEPGYRHPKAGPRGRDEAVRAE